AARAAREAERAEREAAQRAEREATTPANDVGPYAQIEIIFDESAEHRAVDQAIDALTYEHAQVYQRGGLLVHVARDLGNERPNRASAVRRPKESPRICPVQPARLRYELSRLCEFRRFTAKGGKIPIAVP